MREQARRWAPVVVVVLLVLGFALRAVACPSEGPSGLPMISMKVADRAIRVEVAATDAQRARGLMYRRELAANRGMLFVYPRPERLSFWMKNTFVPLTIAYIDRDMKIVHLEDMQPQTTTSHPAPVPIPYALEMKQGWFAERGIEVGDAVEFELPKDLVVE